MVTTPFLENIFNNLWHFSLCLRKRLVQNFTKYFMLTPILVLKFIIKRPASDEEIGLHWLHRLRILFSL